MNFIYISCISFMKMLLLPSYTSTDFEVHRNWLAITHSLPFSEWYKNETSEWTLDYPPFFAVFEFMLSKLAHLFDSKMLIIHNLNYKSTMTVFFQRFSVIVTDLLFAYAVGECVRELKKYVNNKKVNLHLLFIIIFCNAGLLLVDHIHFQYNGFLFGVLFLSIARMLQKRHIEGAFWFCVLLNLKHIYLYIAPGYFIYLYRVLCVRTKSDGSPIWFHFPRKGFYILAAVVIAVFIVSFGPFVAVGQFEQVLSRLFPFKRGLCHSYWAPNFWAFYNFIDKILKFTGVKLGFFEDLNRGSMTSGLVKEYDHFVLPSISPLITFILTAVSMVPCLWKLAKNLDNPWQFVRTIIMCGFCSFLFGWHVHEKAILIVILPMSLLCLVSKEEGKLFLLLSVTAHYSLFPLIFTMEETVIKITALLLHASLVLTLIGKYWKSSFDRTPLLKSYEILYFVGLFAIFFYEHVIHGWIGLQTKLPFLPLMITSVYCSVGVLVCWFQMYKVLMNK